ncbi:MAG TPA: hypothetical protein VGC32_03375 [Solirubrobacterales bacterium]
MIRIPPGRAEGPVDVVVKTAGGSGSCGSAGGRSGGGALSLAPDAPAAGAFHVQGVVVIPGDPRASHTRSVVYGSATAHAKGPGPLAIKLAPGAAAKHLLSAGRPLRVHLTITFAAATGGKGTHTTVITVAGA